MAWRWKTTHELPKVRRAGTDDADSTITSPTTTRAATSAARSTNTAGERRLAGGRVRPPPSEKGRRVLVRVRVRARVRSAVGTGLLRKQGVHSAAEVVPAFRVRAVPVEGGAAGRQQHAVTGRGQNGRRPHGLVHRAGTRHRPHVGEGCF